MPNWPKFLNHFSLLKDIATLVSGNVIAGIITLLTIPFIARLFSPEHFGVAALFVSTLAVIGPIATVGYDRAIILPRHDIIAIRLMLLASACLTAFCCSLVVLITFGPVFSTRLNTFIAPIEGLSYLLPIGVFVAGLINIAENWSIRGKKFARVARADVLRAISMPSTRVILGLSSGSSVWGLIIGYLLGLAVKLGVLVKPMPFDRISKLIRKKSLRMGPICQKYRSFPLYNSPAQFVRATSAHLPVFVLSIFFSPVIAGLYAMANRLVGGPADMMASAVRRVYLQRAAALHAQNLPLRSLFIRTTVAMALLGMVPLVILWSFGNEIIHVLLGSNWIASGEFVQILAPWFLVVWITTPASALYVVYDKQAHWFGSQMALALVRFTALSCSYILDASPATALTAFVIGSSCVNAVIVGNMARLVWQDTLIKGS